MDNNIRYLCGTTLDEMTEFIRSNGFTEAAALKIVTAFYRRRISNISSINDIPKKLKEILSSSFSDSQLEPSHSETSSDGSVKYLFHSRKGLPFETVYLPDSKRSTVCVSSQSGCKMGCPFCLTGQLGFRGDLTAGEIVSQVTGIPFLTITHVVFMGMGEPMDNLDEVLKACEILTSGWGLAISPANITVSTVGITPAIKEFLDRSDCNLAVSLFSPFSDEREKVVPAERKYPVREIIDMLKSYPAKKKRRFSLAYIMIDGINDSERHLQELIRIVKGSKVRVNLLPYHPALDDRYYPSCDERIAYFRSSLMMTGISASVRRSRGTDISAACGHLASALKRR